MVLEKAAEEVVEGITVAVTESSKGDEVKYYPAIEQAKNPMTE